MAIDRNVAAFAKILDSRSFDPGKFMLEFLFTADVGAKMAFMDMIHHAISQAPYLLRRAQDRGENEQAVIIYESLISMGRGFDSPDPPG